MASQVAARPSKALLSVCLVLALPVCTSERCTAAGVQKAPAAHLCMGREGGRISPSPRGLQGGPKPSRGTEPVQAQEGQGNSRGGRSGGHLPAALLQSRVGSGQCLEASTLPDLCVIEAPAESCREWGLGTWLNHAVPCIALATEAFPWRSLHVLTTPAAGLGDGGQGRDRAGGLKRHRGTCCVRPRGARRP